MSEDVAPDPLIGSLIGGRYRVLQKLGEGAMGAVYVAEHVKIGRRDAIKLLRTSLSRDAEAIARFSRGARIVSAVRHPNVCAIYDFSDTDDGYQFLAMEYVPGETLKETLDREGRLPIERAVHIARHVASALQAAHEAGIIHRDLKPGNIMLVTGRDGRDEIKVVDFDIAKGPETGGEEVTRHGFVVGTPEYMSPEQLMGETLDGRSDVYSLGLVLFRMLTGTLPFRGENTQDLMVQRLTTAPLTLRDALPAEAFPEVIQAVLDSALQRLASQRCPSAAEFERMLATPLAAPAPPAAGARVASPPAATGPAPSVQAEVPRTRIAPAAAPPSAGTQAPPPAPPSPRRLVPIVAAGVLIVLGGAAAAVALMNPDPAPNPAAADTIGTQPQGSPIVTPPADSPEAAPPVRSVVDPPVREAPGGARVDPPAETTTGPVIDLARVGDVLLQQLDRLDPEQRPGAAAIDAVVDTATAVWRMRAASSEDRAFAAYIIGSAFDMRSDWRRCAQWLDSALAINPDGRGYADLRNKCRGLGG